MVLTFYIVRGIDDYLYLFHDEPVKREYRWETKYSKEPGKIVWDFDHDFDNIKWQDEEPHKISLYTLKAAKERLKYGPELSKVREKLERNLYT